MGETKNSYVILAVKSPETRPSGRRPQHSDTVSR